MANAGGFGNARLPLALDKILRNRGLAAPDGRPLYSYRLTAEEIAALTEPLRKVLAWAGSTCLDTPWCSRAFVAIACNWFRSWRGEGAWGYAPLCAELGFRYRQEDWHHIASAVREGLRWWGRRVRRNANGDAEYLASLICEGGLPLRAIHGSRWLYYWLQSALDLVVHGVDPDQAATKEAWRAPNAFRTDLIPAAAELVGQLHQIKRELPAASARGGLDAIAWLDLNRINWRDALPLDMNDEDAQTLIERVVRRVDRGATADIGVQRGLVQSSDGNWVFTISVALDGHIEHTRLPHELGTRLMGKLRARVRPAGNLLALVSGDLAIMETYEEEETRWWRVRPLRPVKDLPCAAGLRVDLAVEADGAPLGNLTLPNADGLTSGPMAFLPNPEATDRLVLVSCGSHTTRLANLVVAVPEEYGTALHIVSGNAETLGRTDGLDLRLYRIEGDARLELDGQTFRWRTGAERESFAGIEVDGAFEQCVRGFAYKHPLKVFIREASYRRPARNGEVRWRPARGGPWRSWPDNGLRGDVTFVLIRDGVAVSRTTAAVAPPGFSMAAVSGLGRSLAIAGLRGAAVAIEGVANGERAADPLIVERSSATRNHFSLDASWQDGTSWRTELYDRTARPCFTDTSGVELPHGWRGCVDALFGVYAACPGEAKLTIELASALPRRCITRLIRGEAPLYALASDLRALLATTTRLDSTVRLQWIGADAQHIEIGLYDVALEAFEDEVWPSYTDLMRIGEAGAARVTLLATPLVDSSEEYVLEDCEPAAYGLRRFRPPSTSPGGPWLIYGRVDGRFRVRPRVVFTRPRTDLPSTRLMEFVLSADTSVRRENLPQLLQSDAIPDEEIEDARRLIVAFKPRAPLQALDLAAALMSAPVAAVRMLAGCSETEIEMVLALEEEMSFLWSATPVRAWRDAFEKRRAQLAELMSALPSESAYRYARDEIARVLQAIAARIPALGLHVVAAGGPSGNWATDPVREASDCVIRNGHAPDGVIWPCDGLASHLEAKLPSWIQNKQHYCWDVLAAPLVAAGIAAGLVAWRSELVGQLRWARLFDPVYFDRMLPNMLLQLAH